MSYFGTDGIRQEATKFTPDFLANVIRGLTNYAGDNIKIFLAGDTRESTEWILQDLATACETFGLEYASAGILPTPAINYCFPEMGFDFAIDITASHNQYSDNGIKIFEQHDSKGHKLRAEGCAAIDSALESPQPITLVSPTDRANLHDEALTIYLDHLKSFVGQADLSGLHFGLDCANGATSTINKQVFEYFGAKVNLINADSNYGQGINNNCGSTHLEQLINLVKTNSLDFGVAYDGDGDRCLLVDHTGAIVDGDEIIAILANYLQLDCIAISVMANQGLLNWASKNHIKTEITAVGDSNVATAMSEKNIKLGGEQAGHIILPGETTGDGILTSLMVTKVIADTKQSLRNLAHIITKSPQVIVNFHADSEQKTNFKTSDSIKKILLDYNQKLATQNGRLLVRPSGTEPLIRITMWGDDEAAIANLANELKEILIKNLN